MHRGLGVLLLSSLLAGCAGFFPSAATYSPVTAEITEADIYALDLEACHLVADGWHPSVGLGGIAQQTIEGATNNTANAVINPLVPAAGALGGAASALIGGYDLIGQQSIKILVRCVVARTLADHSAIVADPNA